MKTNDEQLLNLARETLDIEIKEAQRMRDFLDFNIVTACQLLLACEGKVVVIGMGKSGLIGRKIAASLASTGTPSFFVHTVEAVHGDLGMIDPRDIVIFISYSGQAHELNALLFFFKENKIPLIAITNNLLSPLAKNSTCVLNIRVKREACPMGLTPTSSVVNTLMMGDVLVTMLIYQRNFGIEQFARLHPGGNLGTRLLKCVHQ